MVGSVPNLFPRVKAGLARLCGGDSQVAHAHIYTHDLLRLSSGWISYIDGEGNKQIEGFLRFVVPQFRIPNAGFLPDQCEVRISALVGKTDSSLESPDANQAVTLKGVVALIGILHRR